MMRIKESYDWTDKTYSFEEACQKRIWVEYCDGQIERLEAQVENLQHAVVTLLDIINNRSEFSAEEVTRLLGIQCQIVHLEEM